MRLTKAMKKAFSIVLAGAMVITGANVGATKASAEDGVVTAFIETSANGWNPADEIVDAKVDTTATDAKTYTVSRTYNTPVTIGDYFAVKIDDLKEVSDTVEFSNVKVWLDGKGIAVAPNYGGDGDCRIELVNNWGQTPMSDALNVSFSKIEIEFDFKLVPAGTTDTKNNVAITVGEVADKADAPVKAFIESDANGWNAADVTVDASVDKTATEAKTYTVSKTYNNATKITDYLAVKIDDMKDVSSTVQFSDVSVWLNGHAIEVAPNTGGDGDCRIELVNNWGKTPIGDNFNNVYFNKIEVQFTVQFVAEGTVDTKSNVAITTVKAEDKADATDLPTGPAEPSTPDDPGTPSDPADSVWSQEGAHAYLGYQTDIWDYRNAYVPDKTHADADSYDYIKAGDDVTYTADVKDVLLEADGEYTVSLAGIDLSGATQFNMLFISTDIERAAYPDVKVTNATVKIDGKVVDGLENVVLPFSKDSNYYQFAISTTYAADWGISTDELKYAGSDNPLEILPEDSIEVTFTISGLGNKVENEPVGPAKGKQFTKGNFVYKVTKQAMTRTNGAATIVGLSKAGKKAKSLTVANTVKSTGTYNVTAIGKNAFKGAAATSVTLNKNIKSIPASAFANCKKLTTLNLKAKLTSVKKNAFKGCAKKITVKGTAKKDNVKTLKKSGYKNFK